MFVYYKRGTLHLHKVEAVVFLTAHFSVQVLWVFTQYCTTLTSLLFLKLPYLNLILWKPQINQMVFFCLNFPFFKKDSYRIHCQDCSENCENLK